MIQVEEALREILAHITVLGTERVALSDGLGRVLAEDVSATLNVPPCDNSAMDGYALRYADIEGASQSSPARLKVIGDLPAGYSFDASVGQGEALRIMTGAPVPPGADTVIRREDTASEGDTADILTPAAPGSNIRRAGEDIRTGDLLFRAGTQLRPAHIGVLASTKRAVLSVYQRPRVAILSTGDELVDIDGDAQQGKIVSSNSYSLAALVAAAGGIPVALGIARDTREALRARLQEGMHADIIVSSGGVSVGDYDFVKEVLSDLGVEMKFWKVSMRPGQPQAFGMIGGKPTFGLPGNPVSVMVSFEQFVKPAMRKMMGHTKLFGRTVTAVAQERVLTAKGKKYFLRCTVSSGDSGFQVTTTGAQGSGILMSMAQANGLLIVPADRDVVEPGELVKVQVLDPEFDFTAEMNC